MSMPTDPVASLPSGLIDRLLRAAVAAPEVVADEPAGRFMARLLLELADRDDEVLLHTYLAVRPTRPPQFAVQVSKAGATRPDEVLDGLGVSRALRAAAARVGIDDQTMVEVVAREPDLGDNIVFRAEPGEELTFLLPNEGAGGPAAAWARRLRSWAESLDEDGVTTTSTAHETFLSPRRSEERAPVADAPTVVVDIPRDDLLRAISEAVAELSVQVEVDDLADTIARAVDKAIDGRDFGSGGAPTVSGLTAEDLARAMRESLPSGPSKAELADAVRQALRDQAPAGPSAAAVADAVREAVRDEVSPPPTATAVADAVRDALRAGSIAADVADHLHGKAPQAVTAEELADAVGRVLPSAADIAAAVTKALPPPPAPSLVPAVEASDIAQHLLDRLPAVPSAREVANAVGTVVPSAGDIAERLGPARIEVRRDDLAAALRPAIADVIAPLLPSPADVASQLLPAIERMWARVEQATLDRLADVPRSSDLDELRNELQSLQEQLTAARTAFNGLVEEVIGSSRKSREQIDALTVQLGDDLHRWSRRIEDRLDQLSASSAKPADIEQVRRSLAVIEAAIGRIAGGR